jgi:hypothetical protein
MSVARGILKMISCDETDSETLSGLASLHFVSVHIRFQFSAFIEIGSFKRVLQDGSLFFMKGGWFQGRR